ncbi:putative quinol monooxygenase [Lawsonibacter celer]|jgi:quinol monooxygenase YgiN|uniref:putative quinol monooxygenase n=1 Tax=Lawsonibacter celer TaxID=2986526 RepID=UPI0016442276|nr:antibiotic biosynthesis monooxygenase family protein [Lawsonibacter celer]
MSSQKIVLNVTYHMKPGMREKFVELVREQGVLAGVRAERGCLQYEYFAALEDPDKLFLLECWEDEACLDAHAHSENMERLKQLKEQCALDTQIRRY